MVDLTHRPSACCRPEQQDTCCDASEKDACCSRELNTCGCAAGQELHDRRSLALDAWTPRAHEPH
jgi:hypothetical protein